MNCSRCGVAFESPFGYVRCDACLDYLDSIQGTRRAILHRMFWQTNLATTPAPSTYVLETAGVWSKSAIEQFYAPYVS